MGMVSRLAKKKAKAEARAEADRLVEESYEKLCRKMDGLWMYTLHVTFGFGKKRLERLYWAMIDNYIKITKKYNGMCDEDDMEWFAMEKHLQYIGVDLKALQAEADKRYPKGARAEVKEEHNNAEN